MRLFFLTLLPLSLAACQDAAPLTPPSPPPGTEQSITLEATPLSGPAPLEVTFSATATAYTPDYLWDFGDGGEATYTPESQAIYSYDTPGQYTATVTVGTSEDNFTDTVSITVE